MIFWNKFLNSSLSSELITKSNTTLIWFIPHDIGLWLIPTRILVLKEVVFRVCGTAILEKPVLDNSSLSNTKFSNDSSIYPLLAALEHSWCIISSFLEWSIKVKQSSEKSSYKCRFLIIFFLNLTIYNRVVDPYL